MDTLDDVLAHYGILGMKWGVRRTQAQLGRTKKKKKTTKRSFDAQRAENVRQKAKKGGPKSLSNQEIEQLNKRMNLEKNYADLMDKNSKISQGKVLVDAFLATGKTVNEAMKFINSPFGKEVIKLLKQKKE